MTTYEIRQGTDGYTFYGGARDFVRYKGPEAIVSGPAETGKTLAALYKLHICACKYAGASIVITRKTLASTYSTVLETFIRKVLRDDLGSVVVAYGGQKPQWFDYPNGARIWLAGLDKSSKVLSSEHDVIYVNQAEELSLEDWEILTTRTTGRAGNMPYSQTIGDMNPAWPTHWVYGRESLEMFYSYHGENPALYDQDTGEITDQGRRTMAVLEALTGVRRIRLLDGRAAVAEGAVYQGWDPGIHLVDWFEIPRAWRRFRVVDFGFVNPFVCQWWAVDPDGRAYLYRQIYHTRRTVATHSSQIKGLSEGEAIETTICDHDAEDRATLAENGIPNAPADKAVSVGIEKVTERLKVGHDGRSRLFILRDSLVERDPLLAMEHKPTDAAGEFPGYVWSNSQLREVPVKRDDHGLDALRYAVMYLDRPAEEYGPPGVVRYA